MKKRIVCAILCLCMMLEVFPLVSVAAGFGVSTLSAKDIGTTYATIVGRADVNGGYNFKGYGFMYREASSGSWKSDGWRNGHLSSGSVYSFRLTGLKPGTEYEYEFYASSTNSALGTTYGDVKSFTTSGEQKSYQITYNANGGNGAPASAKVSAGIYTISSKTPTRSGYTFEGWADSKTGSAKYDAGELVNIAKDITLYAVWKEKKREVLDTPEITSPVNGSTCEVSDIKFSWSDVNGKTYFLYSVRDMTDDRSIYENVRTTSRSVTVPKSELYNGHEIKFAVGAYNSTLASDWDTVTITVEDPESAQDEMYSTLTITSPLEDRTYSAENDIVFSWNALGRAAYYMYTVRDLINGDYLKDNLRTAGKSITISRSSLTAGHLYLFALSAFDRDDACFDVGNVIITVEETGSETVSVLDTPQILSPEDGSAFDGNADVTFCWSDVAGRRDFMYSVRDMTDDNSIIYNKTTTSCSVTISKSMLPKGHEIKFAVGAYSDTAASDWADATISITPDTVTMFTTGISSPADGQIFDGKSDIDFYWISNPFAAYIRYGVKDLTTGKIIKESNVNSFENHVTISSSVLTPGHTYCLYVRSNTETEWAEVTVNIQKAAESVTVTYNANGGSGAPSAETTASGSTYTVSTKIPTKNGCAFKGWSTTQNGSVLYTGGQKIKLIGKLTLYAVWEKAADYSGHWGEEFIDFVTERGLIDKDGKGNFQPDVNVDRATLLTALYRIEGSPSAADAGFTDVSKNAWYASAVNWAKEVKVTSGVSETMFAPDKSISREEMAAMLYRYFTLKYCADGYKANLSKYTDASSIHSWAKDAFSWAVSIGLLQGRSAAALAPQGTATRAEAATVLKRFVEFLSDGNLQRHILSMDMDAAVSGSGVFRSVSQTQHQRISVEYFESCSRCGYSHTVTINEAGARAAHLWKWKSYTTRYDEKQHWTIGTQWCAWSAGREICHCCDENGNVPTKEITDANAVKTNHTFDENGICTGCGYKKTVNMYIRRYMDNDGRWDIQLGDETINTSFMYVLNDAIGSAAQGVLSENTNNAVLNEIACNLYDVFNNVTDPITTWKNIGTTITDSFFNTYEHEAAITLLAGLSTCYSLDSVKNSLEIFENACEISSDAAFWNARNTKMILANDSGLHFWEELPDDHETVGVFENFDKICGILNFGKEVFKLSGKISTEQKIIGAVVLSNYPDTVAYLGRGMQNAEKRNDTTLHNIYQIALGKVNEYYEQKITLYLKNLPTAENFKNAFGIAMDSANLVLTLAGKNPSSYFSKLGSGVSFVTLGFDLTKLVFGKMLGGNQLYENKRALLSDVEFVRIFERNFENSLIQVCAKGNITDDDLNILIKDIIILASVKKTMLGHLYAYEDSLLISKYTSHIKNDENLLDNIIGRLQNKLK